MTHNRINYLEILHENGYRITSQRQAVLDAICAANGHACIAEIYRRAKCLDAGIDRSTIYRSLEAFEKIGIVISSETIRGERTYEIVKEQPHHHLFCKQCGHEIELDNQLVDRFFSELEDAYQYQILMDHLTVFGLCPACAASADDPCA